MFVMIEPSSISWLHSGVKPSSSKNTSSQSCSVAKTITGVLLVSNSDSFNLCLMNSPIFWIPPSVFLNSHEEYHDQNYQTKLPLQRPSVDSF